jgi:hypothetical protein
MSAASQNRPIRRPVVQLQTRNQESFVCWTAADVAFWPFSACQRSAAYGGTADGFERHAMVLDDPNRKWFPCLKGQMFPENIASNVSDRQGYACSAGMISFAKRSCARSASSPK